MTNIYKILLWLFILTIIIIAIFYFTIIKIKNNEKFENNQKFQKINEQFFGLDINKCKIIKIDSSPVLIIDSLIVCKLINDLDIQRSGRYLLSLSQLMESIKAASGSLKDAVELMVKGYSELHWDGMSFGGKSWGNIAQAWLRLYNSSSLNENIISIDHINHQHIPNIHTNTTDDGGRSLLQDYDNELFYDTRGVSEQQLWRVQHYRDFLFRDNRGVGSGAV